MSVKHIKDPLNKLGFVSVKEARLADLTHELRKAVDECSRADRELDTKTSKKFRADINRLTGEIKALDAESVADFKCFCCPELVDCDDPSAHYAVLHVRDYAEFDGRELRNGVAIDGASPISLGLCSACLTGALEKEIESRLVR